jgi:hypothetical protein
MLTMGIVLFNYAALLMAMILPWLAFGPFELSRWPTSAAAFVSLGLVVAVVWNQFRARARQPTAEMTKHLDNQRSVIFVFVIGGLVGAFHLIWYYEQFRWRVDMNTIVQMLSWILWLLAAMMVVTGMARALRSYRPVRTSAPEPADAPK